jgi:mono/diheme cytochrome c family protein
MSHCCIVATNLRSKRSSRGRIAALAMVGLSLATTGCSGRSPRTVAAQSSQHLDFNQDVQPILASNCFSCHGPDPAARKGNLRLDLEEAAFRKRPGKADAIVPGHPERSEMIKRIEDKDPHYLMPQSPQGEAKPMKPQEIAVLREWIAEGAHYRPHWAFEKPTRAPIPTLKQAGWVKTPIDAFVLERLNKAGLPPSPEADKATLIRRVTLDLTGLLPTPQEVSVFLQDTSPQAYEHVVDRLLAKPAYGEQRARYWLDYARYADTHGLHFDNNRHIWPYRDYLIKAFNANMPFDLFAKEQIAGDMLPAQNLDPIIASGYVRAGVSSNEGGTIPEELKFNIARERAEAYGATFMGLTVGCAVCHDHKYDPTTQKDFYQLTAFFNNINEQPFNMDMPDWAPVVRIPRAEKVDAYNRVLAKRSDLYEQLRASQLQERTLIQRWLDSKQQPPQPVPSDKLQLRLRLNEGGGDVIKNSAPNATPASFPIGKSQPQWGETTWLWPDFRIDTMTRITLGQAGDFEWDQPFSMGGWMMVRSAPVIPAWKIRGALVSKMETTQENRGWDLATDQGIISVDLVDGAPEIDAPAAKKPAKTKQAKPGAPPRPVEGQKPSWAIQGPIRWPVIKGSAVRVSTAAPVVADGQWQHFFFTYDGSGRAAGIKMYVNGFPVPTRIVSDSLGRKTIRTSAPMKLGMRSPDTQPARDTRYQDLRLYARALTPEEVKRLPYEDYVSEIANRPTTQWTDDQWHAASTFYFDSIDESAKRIRGEIKQLDAELEKLSAGGDISIVSEEKSTLAYADVLNRGIYSARKERVEADTPHFLPPLPKGMPHDRLALADWTVSPDNPLTARVTVNRMWNELFGAGLVETTEDFGIMGQRPSNPELLDWLAVEFRESGWDVKHIYKLMVMSAVYRQSAKSTPEQLAKDPKNLLLARGPRFRMDGEELRDIALQTSGLLVKKIGGPSVKPYQPPNVWESVGYPTSDTTDYTQEHGDALYRRSLYTYWKRMAMPPDMDAFDAPSRDTACTRRQRTDTPLQALVTMNDTQWIEASRVLAEHLIEGGGQQPEQRIRYLSELVLSHDPSPRMESVLQHSLKQMEEHYTADPHAARELIAVGEKPRNPAIPAPELAAWTMVVSEMMNLDETLNK